MGGGEGMGVEIGGSGGRVVVGVEFGLGFVELLGHNIKGFEEFSGGDGGDASLH